MLADELRPFVLTPTAPRMGLSFETKLAITLRDLKDIGCVTVTANAFDVSRSTVSSAVRTVSITETRICVENDLKLYQSHVNYSGHEVSGAVGDMSTMLPTRGAGQKIPSKIV